MDRSRTTPETGPGRGAAAAAVPVPAADADPPVSARWRATDEALETTFAFASFGDAIGFMAAAVPGIDRMDHHPDWSNAHRRVRVSLSSHDVGRVTARDRRLAAYLDALYEALGGEGASGAPADGAAGRAP